MALYKFILIYFLFSEGKSIIEMLLWDIKWMWVVCL